MVNSTKIRKWEYKFINDFVDSKLVKEKYKSEQELVTLKDGKIPPALYKFFKPTIYSLATIFNNQVFLANPGDFNDPFDSHVCIEEDTYCKLHILQQLKAQGLVGTQSPNMLSDSEYWKIRHSVSSRNSRHNRKSSSYYKVLDEIIQPKNQSLKDTVNDARYKAYKASKEILEQIRSSSFRISSFANLVDDDALSKNITMWSHYADEHRGFCVKYKTDNYPLKHHSLTINGLFPVSYTSKLHFLSPHKLLETGNSINMIMKNPSLLKAIIKSMLTKSRHWNYEKEWRLIMSADEANVLGNMIDFYPIEEIYLGCRMPLVIKKVLIEIAEKNGIKVSEARQENEEYSLNFRKMTKDILEEDIYYSKLSEIQNDIKDQEFKAQLYSLLEKTQI